MNDLEKIRNNYFDRTLMNTYEIKLMFADTDEERKETKDKINNLLIKYGFEKIPEEEIAKKIDQTTCKIYCADE